MDLLAIGRTLNISPLSVIFAVLLLLLGILYLKLQSRPPGPWGLPVLGIWPFLKNNEEHIQLQKYMKKYGDVYSFTCLGKLYIHVGSMKSAKEALLTKSDCFTDRFTGFSIFNAFFKEGMLVENGEHWTVLRKFFMNAFREHNISSVKDYMSGPILDSVYATVDDLRTKNGEPTDIIPIINRRSAEILRRVFFNDQEMSEEELNNILGEYYKILPTFDNRTALLNGNFARYFIYPFMKEFKVACDGNKNAVAMLQKVVERHEDSFNINDIRNIIDSYIKERIERRSKGDHTASYFTEESLVSSLLQFVGDGGTAVAIFIGYIINDLLDYPEEQEKVYKELEEVLGPDQQPTLQDRSRLPYLNAFMQEVQRSMSFINIFNTAECSKSTTLNGHHVPKGSLFLLNMHACHKDPNVYDEPNKFKPSRYIAEEGRKKAEAPIMFGTGKRSCIGETFVNMQAFLFLAAVIKNFRLARPEGVTKRVFPDIVMHICAYPRK